MNGAVFAQLFFFSLFLKDVYAQYSSCKNSPPPFGGWGMYRTAPRESSLHDGVLFFLLKAIPPFFFSLLPTCKTGPTPPIHPTPQRLTLHFCVKACVLFFWFVFQTASPSPLTAQKKKKELAMIASRFCYIPLPLTPLQSLLYFASFKNIWTTV